MGGLILWSVLALLILLGVIAIVVVKKGNKTPTDYYTLFVMGAIWFPFGIILKLMDPELFLGNLFFVLGLIYAVVGLAHKKEWKSNRRSWKKLTKKEKKFKLVLIFLLLILVITGVVAYCFM